MKTDSKARLWIQSQVTLSVCDHTCSAVWSVRGFHWLVDFYWHTLKFNGSLFSYFGKIKFWDLIADWRRASIFFYKSCILATIDRFNFILFVRVAGFSAVLKFQFNLIVYCYFVQRWILKAFWELTAKTNCFLLRVKILFFYAFRLF